MHLEVKPPAPRSASPTAESHLLNATSPTDKHHPGVPHYMTEVYDWAYVNPQKAHWLDNNLVVKVLLFLNDQRLMRLYLDEIRPGSKVWQLAHVYGDLVTRAAQKVGPQGQFDVTDITPIQVEHARHKLQGMPWAQVIRSDAATFTGRAKPAYDLICSFFLLHEVPDDKKHDIVNHLLTLLPKQGKIVFVDYHAPAVWQPVRYILKIVNHYLEPFSNTLWRTDIRSFASAPEQFTWHKRTFFGGVYQCVIVEHADKSGNNTADKLHPG